MSRAESTQTDSTATVRYKAFISYSHKDEQAARWLHRALERYRVPRSLVSKPGPTGPIERRLYPIFRDRDEFSSSADLTTAVRVALERSDFQVVVCSPSAALSRWVNEELLAFKRMGRADRVIALIADGEPNAATAGLDGAAECFPPALRFKLGADGALTDEPVEPLAADIRPHKDGRRGALLKIISGLLGVRLDVLRQRDAAQRRRRLIVGVSVLVVAAGAPMGAVIWGNDYLFKTPYEIYGNAFAFDGAKPRLVGAVRRSSGAARADVFYGIRRGRWGELVWVAGVNSFKDVWRIGTSRTCALQPLAAVFPPFAVIPVWFGPTPYSVGIRANSRPCALEFAYDRPTSATAATGMRLFNQWNQAVAEITMSDAEGTLSVQGAPTFDLPASGLPYGLEFERDARRRIIRVRFVNPRDRSPLRASGTATRIDYAYDDASGLVTSIAFFDQSGRPASSSFAGRSRFRLAYDERGLLRELEGFDPDGVSRWSAGREDPPKRAFTYDVVGNRRSIAFLGPDGKPEDNGQGVAEIRLETKNGVVTDLAYLRADGTRATTKEVICSREHYVYDVRLSGVECFDEHDRPALDGLGVHGQRARYNLQGQVAEEEFRGTDGGLVARRDLGIARTEYTYNDRGQQVATAHFGPDGEPALFRGTGAARVESMWDEHGRQIEDKRFGVDGRLRVDPDVGYAVRRLGYDSGGAENKHCYFDANDRPMIHPKEGFACRRRSREERPPGQVIRGYAGPVVVETTWTEGADGKPVVPPQWGFAKYQRELTLQGILLMRRVLDKEDLLVEVDGWAEQQNRFDEQGRFTGVYFVGVDGRLRMNRICGYAALDIVYVPDAPISLIQLRGPRGERINHRTHGYSTIRRATGEDGPPPYIALDATGRPVQSGTFGWLLDDLASGRIYDEIRRFLSDGGDCLL